MGSFANIPAVNRVIPGVVIKGGSMGNFAGIASRARQAIQAKAPVRVDLTKSSANTGIVGPPIKRYPGTVFGRMASRSLQKALAKTTGPASAPISVDVGKPNTAGGIIAPSVWGGFNPFDPSTYPGMQDIFPSSVTSQDAEPEQAGFPVKYVLIGAAVVAGIAIFSKQRAHR